MTGLLISVKDAHEARIALESGADLIDIKDPHYALGRCDQQTWSQVCHLVCGQRPVSLALGELLSDWPCSPIPARLEIDFLKIGLAGCGEVDEWERAWADALAELPARAKNVAVAYVDWQRASSPTPDEVLSAATRLGCHAFLLDTFDKRQGSLFDHLSLQQAGALVGAAREHGFLSVLGGSISLETLDQAISLSPDFVAIRGAACRDDRAGRIDGALTSELVDRIATQRTGHADGKRFRFHGAAG